MNTKAVLTRIATDNHRSQRRKIRVEEMITIITTITTITTITIITTITNIHVRLIHRNPPCPPEPSCPPQVDPFHGQVTKPQSRGGFIAAQGWLGDTTWRVNEMEGGKNFPLTTAGAFVPMGNEANFTSDYVSAVPPPDGLILSGGRTDERSIVNYSEQELSTLLNYQGGWPKVQVLPGENFNVTWAYTAVHRTRGYRWFITRDGWNPSRRPTRADFESEPFYSDFHPFAPFNEYTIADLPAVVEHSVTLPANKTGHHILLLLWIVADTGNAFYQAFDLNFYQQVSVYPAWRMNVMYETGARVSHNGKNWEAKWQNANVAPGTFGSGGYPWLELS